MKREEVDLSAPMAAQTKVVADSTGQIMLETELVMSDADLEKRISTTHRMRLLPFQAEELSRSLREAAEFLAAQGAPN